MQDYPEHIRSTWHFTLDIDMSKHNLSGETVVLPFHDDSYGRAGGVTENLSLFYDAPEVK